MVASQLKIAWEGGILGLSGWDGEQLVSLGNKEIYKYLLITENIHGNLQVHWEIHSS